MLPHPLNACSIIASGGTDQQADSSRTIIRTIDAVDRDLQDLAAIRNGLREPRPCRQHDTPGPATRRTTDRYAACASQQS